MYKLIWLPNHSSVQWQWFVRGPHRNSWKWSWQNWFEQWQWFVQFCRQIFFNMIWQQYLLHNWYRCSYYKNLLPPLLLKQHHITRPCHPSQEQLATTTCHTYTTKHTLQFPPTTNTTHIWQRGQWRRRKSYYTGGNRDEHQHCRAAIAVAQLAAAAWEAKEGLPPAAGEETEASRRPQYRCARSPRKDWAKLDLVDLLVLDQRTAVETGF